MPIRIHCPSCQSALQMPETMYGKAVRCPSCKNAFQCPSAPGGAPPAAVPAPPPPPPAARPVSAGGSPFDFNAPAAPPAAVPAAQPYAGGYGYEEPYTPRRRTPWGKMRLGLVFVEIGAILLLVPTVILYVMSLGDSRPSPGAGKAILTAAYLLYLSAAVMTTLGFFFCSAVPARSGAKGTILFGSLLYMVGTIAAGFIIVVGLIETYSEKPIGMEPETIAIIMNVATGGLFLGNILYMFFMLLCALFLQQRGLGGMVIAWYVLTVALRLLSTYAARLAGVVSRGEAPFLVKGPFWYHFAFMALVVLTLWFILLNVFLSSGSKRAERRGQA